MRLYPLRFVPVFLGLIVLLWFVPMLFNRVTKADWIQTNGYYSSLRGEFVLLESGPNVYRYTDENGTRLPLREARLSLPFLYSRDVEKWQGFPLEAGGRTFSYTDAQAVKLLRVTPRITVLPPERVHILQESAPETSAFALPPDVLLLDDRGVRFVNCANGSLNAAKSQMFTQALREAGVIFPLRACGGNSSPYKDIDEGLFLADAEGHVFQLLMRKGKPVCHRLDDAPVVGARQFFVNESRSSPVTGLLAADDGLYVLERGKAPHRLPVAYDYAHDSVSAFFTPVDASISVRPLGPFPMLPSILTALDAKKKTVRSMEVASAGNAEHLRMQQKWLSFLCPVTITQFTPYLPHARFLVQGPVRKDWAACGILLALALAGTVRRRQGQTLRQCWPELLLTLFFGLPALILLVVFGPLSCADRQCGTGACSGAHK